MAKFERLRLAWKAEYVKNEALTRRAEQAYLFNEPSQKSVLRSDVGLFAYEKRFGRAVKCYTDEDLIHSPQLERVTQVHVPRSDGSIDPASRSRLVEIAEMFTYSLFGSTLVLESNRASEYLPSKETRKHVTNFISTLVWARVISGRWYRHPELIKHISDAVYIHTVVNADMAVGAGNVPTWFKASLDQIRGAKFFVGTVEGLDSMDGFGIASISDNHWGIYDNVFPGFSSIDIYCFPHYRHFQWNFRPQFRFLTDAIIQYYFPGPRRSHHDSQTSNMWSLQNLSSLYFGLLDLEADQTWSLWFEHNQKILADRKRSRSKNLGYLRTHESSQMPRIRYSRLTERQIKTYSDSQDMLDDEPRPSTPTTPSLRQFAAWKYTSGKTKSWKACRVIKLNGKQSLTSFPSRLIPLLQKGISQSIPGHEWSREGYRKICCWKSGGIVRSENLNKAAILAIDSAFRSRRKCSSRKVCHPAEELVAAIETYCEDEIDESDTAELLTKPSCPKLTIQPPPRNLRHLFPSVNLPVPGHNVLRLGTYADMIIAPCYLLRQVRSVETHVSTYEATDLNDADIRYCLKAVNINILHKTTEGRALYQYRLKVVKRLQKQPEYLNTVGKYGLIWIVQRPASVTSTVASKSKAKSGSYNFLKRGSREFKSAFPQLPGAPKQKMDQAMGKPSKTSNQTPKIVAPPPKPAYLNRMPTVRLDKVEKEREAQRRRRMFKREWARMQAVVNVITKGS